MINNSNLIEMGRGFSKNRIVNNANYFRGVNVITSCSFLTATTFVIVKSFWESFTPFAVFLSIIYAGVNVVIYLLGDSQSVIAKPEKLQSSLTNTTDNSLAKDGLARMFICDPSTKGKGSFKYYPSIEAVVQPLFSRKMLFNSFVYRVILSQALFSHLFILYSQQRLLLSQVLITSVVVLVLSVLFYVVTNREAYRLAMVNLKNAVLN